MQPQPTSPEILPHCAESGPGARCHEAQADGVPCAEICDCDKCGRAIRPRPVTQVLATAS